MDEHSRGTMPPSGCCEVYNAGRCATGVAANATEMLSGWQQTQPRCCKAGCNLRLANFELSLGNGKIKMACKNRFLGPLEKDAGYVLTTFEPFANAAKARCIYTYSLLGEGKMVYIGSLFIKTSKASGPAGSHLRLTLVWTL